MTLVQKEVKKVYLGTHLVRPTSGTYTPTANTIAYFPLVNDILDKVGSATITNNGIAPTPSTIGFTFTNNGETSVANANFWSLWSKLNTYNRNYINTLGVRGGYAGYYYKHTESTLNRRFYVFYNSSLARDYSGQTSNLTGAWHHFCLGNNNGNWTFYLDGSEIYSTTNAPYSSSSVFAIFSAWDGVSTNDTADVSEVIIENTARSSTQVSNYYNSTKGNYGIS